MSAPMQQLKALLETLKGSACFAASGTLPPPVLGLEVAGIGPIGLPVSPEDARRLIAVSEQAPYGRGEATIVDTDVRRVRQIEADRVKIRNPGWEQELAGIVDAVKSAFGVRRKVRHELYKLLVYEEGSFFVAHRDTEKLPGMFATLVVCLPSRHEGGALTVEHDGARHVFDSGGPESEFRISYAAFYADCRHEISPVRSGYRICLVYNLALTAAQAQPGAPRNAALVEQTAELVRELLCEEGKGLDKLVIPFHHQYTRGGLSLADLKGEDRARWEVVSRAAEVLGYECFAALATHHQSGSVDYNSWTPPSLRRRYSRHDRVDEDAAEFEELDTEESTLDHWLDQGGKQRKLGRIRFIGEEVVGGASRKGWSRSQQLHEATGNEGATLDRWYSQGAMVLWPKGREYRILAAEGPAVALPELQKRLSTAKSKSARAACLPFAAAIVARWPPPDHYARAESELPKQMLGLIELAGSAELAERFIVDVLPAEFTGREGPEIVRLCDAFGWEALRPSICRLLAAQRGESRPAPLARIVGLVEPLYCGPGRWSEERRRSCAAIAADLAVVVDQWRLKEYPPYLRREACKGMVAGLVRIFGSVDALDRLEGFLADALSGAFPCDLHEVLIPDLRTIAGMLEDTPGAGPAYATIRRHCLAKLRAATAEPVLAPQDWSRETDLGCACPRCQAIARFLADPNERVGRFPLAEQDRRHVHYQIDRHRCDCTHVTERKGRPYTLVCTKNQASYERRKLQYEVDTVLLGELEALPA